VGRVSQRERDCRTAYSYLAIQSFLKAPEFLVILIILNSLYFSISCGREATGISSLTLSSLDDCRIAYDAVIPMPDLYTLVRMLSGAY
jgi:hypothetical protein